MKKRGGKRAGLGRKRRGQARLGLKGGFVSFDLLFAVIPLILMLSHLLMFTAMASQSAESRMEFVSTSGKLASIADYIVEQGAAESSGVSYLGGAHYRPNLIDEAKFSQIQSQTEEIRKRMELRSLEIDWNPADGTCIHRLVMEGDEIKMLYVCGE